MEERQTPLNPPDDAISRWLDKARSDRRSTVEIVKDMLGDGPRLTVNLGSPPELPVRKESPRRSHWFNDLKAFCRYLEGNTAEGGVHAVVLCDPESLQWRAVLDDGAQRGFETIGFSAAVHPLMKPWKELCDDEDRLMPAEFAEFVVRNKSVVVSPDPQQLALTLRQVRLAKKVESDFGAGAEARNGVMVESSVRGQVGQTFVELPETIRIVAPVFIDGDPVEVLFDVMIDSTGDKPTVSLASNDLTVQMVKQMLKWEQTIAAAVPCGVVGFGCVRHEAWGYVEGGGR